ncbi:hypothetical protein [Arthrobacter sp. UYEF36]|uniref:hypothetical protein n=1 Tax=Arthrobacter sp. UYEF36 TaxID=1756366 RepID=UPI0033953392
MESPASPQAQHQRPELRRGGVAGFLWGTVSRARTARIPFRMGQVLIGDDPFNGRHLGTVAVIDAPYVGLRTASAAGEVTFYDYRQLRYPD